MKKYLSEFMECVGYLLLVVLPLIAGHWFIGGGYKNDKIECLKQHPGEETHYNLLSGCWYWSERQQKMIKSDDVKERELIEEEKRHSESEELIRSWYDYKDLK